MSRIALLLGVALAATGCSGTGSPAVWPGAAAAQPDRTATLLAINDSYRIEGLDDGSIGGMARVRALRTELEREAPDLLMLHAGDFLFPSFASRMYRGEQMLALMNVLDGDPKSFDERMFVTFGNHEFERAKMKDAGLLDARIQGSQFRWLAGNITFARGPDGLPLVAAKNLTRTALVESGGIRIGIFGLTLPLIGIEYVEDFAAVQATARALSAGLRARNAEIVVALTHLNAADDRRLLEALGANGPDIIIGGHDHDAMARNVGGRWVLKAGADARSANVVRLTMKGDGSLHVSHELRKLAGSSPSPDERTQQLVNQWQARHAREFCAAARAAPGCLDEVYGRTRTDLGGEESRIRGAETSLGNWVADRMLEAFKTCGAQVAFINSGSLRLDRDLPRGTTITRRHLEELFAYRAPLHLLRVDGATLMKVANQSVRGWPGAGSWLQIGGFAYRHGTAERIASDLTWLPSNGGRPIRPDEPVLAVTGDYLINAQIGDQDGYLMLNRGQEVKDCAVNGTSLKAVAIRALTIAGERGIAPEVEGRICQGGAGAPCLAAQP